MTTRLCTSNNCERPVQSRGMCTTHYSNWYRENAKQSRQCDWCGETFTTARTDTRFCGMSCGGKYANSLSMESEGWQQHLASIAKSTALVRRTLPRSWFGSIISGGAWVSGPCLYCHSPFTAKGGGRYCSDRCRQRAKETRRYQLRGKFAVTDSERYAIYKRDHNTCQLCMNPVDTMLDYTHPMSATLDHIIPQSWQLIPDHSERNLRMAHRVCNSRRGNRAAA